MFKYLNQFIFGFVIVGTTLVNTSTSLAQSIVYKAHVQNIGWQNSVSDGAIAGTTGQEQAIEAINIITYGLPSQCSLVYNVHAADVGWMGWTSESSIAGTTGQGRRLEAIAIKLKNCPGWSVEYKVHISDVGWMGWESNGDVAGTTGQERRLEAILIRLRRN
jgi:uncharacterized protein YjdB